MSRRSWSEVTLGEHVDLLTGFPFKSAKFTTSDEDTRLLRGDNIGQGRLRWDGVKRWPADDIGPYCRYELAEGDVILAMDRPWIDAGLKWACVRGGDVPALLVQRVARMRGSRGLDARFLPYVIAAPDFTDYVKTITTGANVPHISAPDIKRYSFTLPPLPIQRRIADILCGYDDLIENNTKRIKILEEMARSLYREWFVNFRFPGHEKVKMVSSPLGKVPEGWEVARLGELVDDKRDAVQPADLDPDTPYFGLEHLPRRSLALNEWGRAADVQSTKLRVQPLDILFGKIRPYFHKVGPSPVVGVCSSDTIVLRARPGRSYGAVLSVVSSDDFVRHATQTSQGTKMPRANWDVLQRYPVPIAPMALQNRFDAMIIDSVTLLRALVFKNRALARTRDLLLPRLISGELPVDAAEAP